MPIESYLTTQYTMTCDACGKTEVCADGAAEGVRNKRQALKWAGMCKTKKGVFCLECLKKEHEKDETD